MWRTSTPPGIAVGCTKRAQSPAPIQAASGVFAATIAHAIAHGHDRTPQEIYTWVLDWAHKRDVPEPVLSTLQKAAMLPPADYEDHQGWVLIALQNAFHQLLNAPGPI